jgi:hypothetical protein
MSAVLGTAFFRIIGTHVDNSRPILSARSAAVIGPAIFLINGGIKTASADSANPHFPLTNFNSIKNL